LSNTPPKLASDPPLESHPEVFILEDEQGPIIYAPLTHSVARVNDVTARLVHWYLLSKGGDPGARKNEEETTGQSDECAGGRDDSFTLDEEAALEILHRHKFFDQRPHPQYQGIFKPIQVTLFPTNRCNLRCSYCYAEGGEANEPLVTLDLEAGKAAIDLVSQNALEIRAENKHACQNFLVSFHGNGEPFMAFDILRELCFYAHERAESLGIPVVINTATNGVLSQDELDFLIAYFDNVNVSFDGLPDIQNTQRPLAGGHPSFEAVDQTLRRLDETNKGYGIRATVTADNVDRIREMAAFVAKRYPRIHQLHLEPVWECGRCLTTHDKTPPIDTFISQYLSAVADQENQGVHLVYSGARHDVLGDGFCAVSRGSFTVVPTGDVTACFEVSYASDPRSERYFFGRWNGEQQTFLFDDGKLEALSRLNVNNMPFCTDCFCRWHCAGDCVAKVLELEDPADHRGSDRCMINRTLTLNQLQRRLDYKET
jgi:uncharacterized protein